MFDALLIFSNFEDVLKDNVQYENRNRIYVSRYGDFLCYGRGSPMF